MEARLIRIVEDEKGRTWGGWAAEVTHSNVKRSPMGRLMPSVVPSVDQIKSVGSTVYGAASSLAKLVKKNGNDEISEIFLSQARDIRDVDGSALRKDIIYAMHPLRTENYIRADAMHNYILKEQRSQIIRYFRSSVALKSLVIEIVSQKSGKVYSTGGWKQVSAGGSKESQFDQRHWFASTYSNPQKEVVQNGDELYWMPYFDEIVAATSGKSGGTIETTTTLNTAFGISAEAAKLANIDANWISHQSFVVRAEYA